LLPELVSILRPGTIVRGEEERERRKRTAYCKLQVEERQTTDSNTNSPRNFSAFASCLPLAAFVVT
jgi:hypothetical protein